MKVKKVNYRHHTIIARKENKHVECYLKYPKGRSLNLG